MKKKFKVDVWDRKVTFCLTKESFLKATKEEAEGDCICMSVEGDAYILINLEAFEHLPESALLRSLSHECNHAAIDMLEGCGVPISCENQETICYTQDYIFAMCYEFLESNREPHHNTLTN
tara:strand:+ start:103 stop:465 length:363 start_codon:yes stop_codon:yes gene_type:complete